MRRVPDLSALKTEHSTAVSELRDALEQPPRGGPDWDPFRVLPEVRLTSEGQSELLGVFSEAVRLAEEAELKLSRARTDRSRSAAARQAYRMAEVSSWAQEALLASVSLLLVKRVDLALKRHNRSHADSAEEYMAEAIACAVGCLKGVPEGARFHLYVASAVDAALSQKALEGTVSGSMPQVWKVVMRHLPSIDSDLTTKLGRTPTDQEVGEALLARARSWAAARIVEKGGEVESDILDELVDAKLTKQGMFAAVRHIGEIRAAGAGALSIEAAGDVDLLSGHCAPPADEVSESASALGSLRTLLDPLPQVSDDLEVAVGDRDRVREMLQSSLWRTLVTDGPLPVRESRVSRKTPDVLARLAA